MKKVSGSRIIIGLENGVHNIFPGEFSTVSEIQITRHIYESLLNYSVNSEIIPGVLTNWKVSRNGKKWTFGIKRNSSFHNNSPVNADSVIWNLKEHIIWSTGMAKYFRHLNKIGEYSIQIEFTIPVASLLHLFASPLAFIIAPYKAGNTIRKRKIIGSGPFKLVTPDFNGSYLLERVKTNNSNENLVQFLEFKQLSNGDKMWNSLNLGEVDVIYECPYKFITDSSYRPQFLRKYCGSLSVNMLFLNTNCKVFMNLSARQLLAKSIDKQELINKTMGSVGLASTSPISPASSFHTQPQKKLADIAAISEDLLPLGKEKIHILAQSAYNNHFISEFCAQTLKVGIECEIEKMPVHSLINRVRSGDYEAAFLGTAGMQDPDFVMYDFFHSKGRHNFSNFKSLKYDGLVDKAREELDFLKRKKLYERAVNILNHEVPAIFLRHGVSLLVHHNKISGIEPYPDNLLRLEWAKLS